MGALGSDAAAKSFDPRLVQAINTFGFRLLTVLGAAQSGENIFISPASIASALAMTSYGARGDTQTEMIRTLQMAGLSPDEINAAFATLGAHLSSDDPRTQLVIANALWASPSARLEEEFVLACRNAHDAEVHTVDFGDGARAADAINAWVEARTQGMIERLVSPEAVARAILVLVNAIYFRGIWQEPFDPAATSAGEFHLLDGTTKSMPMMSRSGNLLAYQDETLQAVNLPYGEGNLGMWIILPRPGSDFPALRSQLDAAALGTLATRFQRVDGSLRLPRFRVNYGASLRRPLRAMGMRRPFSGADFSGIAPDPLAITDVLHEAVMEVDEEGTRAAAATAVVLARGIPGVRFRMVVDRPFYCAIRDNASGLCLFLGAIVDPD